MSDYGTTKRMEMFTPPGRTPGLGSPGVRKGEALPKSEDGYIEVVSLALPDGSRAWVIRSLAKTNEAFNALLDQAAIGAVANLGPTQARSIYRTQAFGESNGLRFVVDVAVDLNVDKSELVIDGGAEGRHVRA